MKFRQPYSVDHLDDADLDCLFRTELRRTLDTAAPSKPKLERTTPLASRWLRWRLTVPPTPTVNLRPACSGFYLLFVLHSSRAALGSIPG